MFLVQKDVLSQEASTIDELLALYTKDVNKENVKVLHVDRESLWERALIFYKSTERKDLYRHLSIVFEGYEDAIDAGGIRIEFFNDLIRLLDLRLFEGKNGHRVPKHSGTMSMCCAWEDLRWHILYFKKALVCQPLQIMSMNF